MSKMLSPPQLSQCHLNRAQPGGIAGLCVVTMLGFLCDMNLIPFVVPQNDVDEGTRLLLISYGIDLFACNSKHRISGGAQLPLLGCACAIKPHAQNH
jgi:hypothetical protein